MTTFLLSHHLGMGDHIVLNGLVRHIYEREKNAYDRFYLLCYEHNKANVARMYDDLKIDLLTVKDDSEIVTAIRSLNATKHEDLHLNDEGLKLYSQIGDDAFFDVYGYDRSLRTKFKINYTKAQKEATKKHVPASPYIFVHDDEKRGFKIEQNRLPKLTAVRLSPDVPLFEAVELIRNAQECHVISSSFLCWLMSDPRLNPNFITHLYLRNEYLAPYLNRYGHKTL